MTFNKTLRYTVFCVTPRIFHLSQWSQIHFEFESFLNFFFNLIGSPHVFTIFFFDFAKSTKVSRGCFLIISNFILLWSWWKRKQGKYKCWNMTNILSTCKKLQNNLKTLAPLGLSWHKTFKGQNEDGGNLSKTTRFDIFWHITNNS